MMDGSVFGCLREGAHIWAIGAVRGDANRLSNLHDALSAAMEPDDRLVYLGNLPGGAAQDRNAVDVALEFRIWVMARRGGDADDVVFLRGAREEMLQKLFELQFAISPSEVLDWMLEKGIGGAIKAYGGNPEEARAAVRQSAVATTRWTSDLRARFRESGHQPWLSSLQHAAYNAEKTTLFVSRGIDATKPLDAQHDIFWWGGGSGFDAIAQPVAGFSRVIRGEDPSARGLFETDITVSLDGGCGVNPDGTLIAVCLSNDGVVLETIEA